MFPNGKKREKELETEKERKETTELFLQSPWTAEEYTVTMTDDG